VVALLRELDHTQHAYSCRSGGNRKAWEPKSHMPGSHAGSSDEVGRPRCRWCFGLQLHRHCAQVAPEERNGLL
jgi:hypothetical protein